MDHLSLWVYFINIFLNKTTGEGAFGQVWEANAKGLTDCNGVPEASESLEMRVAVKMLTQGADREAQNDLINEAKTMSRFHNEHIIRFLGVCLNSVPNLLVLEYMEGGDLREYLR